MIAGLTDITSGELRFDGEVVNEWDVHRRGVAFVFQTYALYPHLTVRENISFPLVMERFRPWHHLPVVNSIARRAIARQPEVASTTNDIAAQLHLTELLDRRPASLSGGQRQRVALGRALIRKPSLYLLDEPLSNLDAKLRTQMRSEISTLHKRVGKTFVYVTHDQVEAMTMATRIIVLDKGEVQQIGTPDEIYYRPANTFVARFVGSPPMNLIPVRRTGNRLHLRGTSWDHQGPLPDGEELLLGIRPEKVEVSPDTAGMIPARVSVVERLGGETLLGCRLTTGTQDVERSLIDDVLYFAKVQGSPSLDVDQPCSLSYQPSEVTWFDRAGKARIEPSIPAAV
jgi:multiple sugar transport system ATP-binding protein